MVSFTAYRYDLELERLREPERLRELDRPPLDDERERPDDEPRRLLDPDERPLAEALLRLRLDPLERPLEEEPLRFEEEPLRLRLDPVDLCRPELRLPEWLCGLCACSRSWMSSKSA
jgi:hypothetical protein